MTGLRELMDSLPTYVRLRLATRRRLSDDAHVYTAVIEFSQQGFGFGEIAIRQTNTGGAYIDGERMSRDRIKAYLAALVDSAILDSDTDPGKHRAYNEAMGRSCNSACQACAAYVDPNGPVTDGK